MKLCVEENSLLIMQKFFSLHILQNNFHRSINCKDHRNKFYRNYNNPRGLCGPLCPIKDYYYLKCYLHYFYKPQLIWLAET